MSASPVTLVTRHPAVMAVRRSLRDARWTVRGRNVANPPMPPAVRSLLFVCLGNICRSPFAAHLAARRLAAAGAADVRCASAGIRTTQGAASPAEACSVAESYGCSLRDHRPALLTRELIAAHDLIVVMERGQQTRLCASYPEAAGRIFLLSLFDDQAGGYARFHIEDPFGGALDRYEACYRRIDRSLSRLIAALPPAAGAVAR
jgi:protein-tyrosine phosphatase